MKHMPVKRQNIADIIIEKIKQKVFDGELKPGDKLPTEEKLGVIFSVGRTSVREALKALSYLGVIERRKEGTYICDNVPSLTLMSHENNKSILKKVTIEELIEARTTLEVKTAGLAAKRCTKDDLIELKIQLEKSNKYSQELNWPEFIKHNNAFHKRIVEASNNIIFMEIYNAIEPFLYNMLITSSAPMQDRMDNIQKQHESIFNAIQAGDVKLAEKTTLQHLGVMGQHINY